jgi:hypothetical protein
MIIKRVFSEQVLRILNGGDYPTSTGIKEQDVDIVAEQARNYLIEKHINTFGDDISEEFVSVYYPTVKRLSKRNRLYIELPAQLVSLRDGKGLRQISPLEDDYNVWIPLKGGSAGMFHGLEAGLIEGKAGYWLEGPQAGTKYPVVIFENIDNTWEGKEVLLKMISSIAGLDDDQVIPIPAAVEIEFLNLVVEILTKQKSIPMDRQNNNNERV